MFRLRAHYRSLQGWKIHLFLALMGAIGVLGYAPFFWLPAYILAISALILALDDVRRFQRPIRAGFARAWSFGAGHFLAGTAWVANAFLVSAGNHEWLIWAPLTLLPGGLALFWGLAGALYVRFAPRHVGKVAVFVTAFMSVEFLRSTLLSGFPWNLPGHVFEAGQPVSQSASLIGAYGLSVMALYLAVSPAALLARGELWRRLAPAGLGLVLLASAYGFGVHRLSATQIEETQTRLALVQVNIPQEEKRFSNRYEVLEQYLDRSLSLDLESVDALIWPEGAIPAFLLDSPSLLRRLTDELPEQTRLITGTPRADPELNEAPEYFYNSMVSLILDETGGQLEFQYDKAKLVPFGEGNPLRSLTRLFGFGSLAEAVPAYDPGPGPKTVSVDGLPRFAPLICYEAIYPRFIERIQNRPEWLLNISNDSWYGNSSGPKQLLNQTQYRSIEEGIPLIRVASAGVSGQVDALGRLRNSQVTPSTETFTITLLEGLDAPPYARYGNALCVFAWLILVSLTQFIAVVKNSYWASFGNLHEGR